jgi:hypothetical protein
VDKGLLPFGTAESLFRKEFLRDFATIVSANGMTLNLKRTGTATFFSLSVAFFWNDDSSVLFSATHTLTLLLPTNVNSRSVVESMALIKSLVVEINAFHESFISEFRL